MVGQMKSSRALGTRFRVNVLRGVSAATQALLLSVSCAMYNLHSSSLHVFGVTPYCRNSLTWDLRLALVSRSIFWIFT